MIDSEYSEDMENTIIFYKNQKLSNEQKKIQFISINYLLYLLLTKDLSILISIDNDFSIEKFIIFFLQHHFIFINTSILLNKIISIYEFYTKKGTFLSGLSLFLFYFIYIIIYNKNETDDLLKKVYSFIKKINKNKAYSNNEILSGLKNTLKEILSLKNKTDAYENIIKNVDYINTDVYLNITQIYSKSDDLYEESTTFIKESSNYNNWNFNILDWSAKDIAEQITLQSQMIFLKIHPMEFINSAWTKKNKYKTSTSIMTLIDRFNKLFYWIIEEIFRYDKKSIRVKVIEKIICVALYLKKMNNFNDLIMVVSVLNSNLIKKLEKTLFLLSPKLKNLMIKLTNLCSYEKNYLELRKKQNVITNSKLFKSNNDGIQSIPYLGLLLRDLCFSLEGESFIYEKNYINCGLINLQGNFIYNFLLNKDYKYEYFHIPNFRFLKNTCPLDENELYEIADKLEPKFILYNVKRVSKRPSKTDLNHFFVIKNTEGIENVEVIGKVNLINDFVS